MVRPHIRVGFLDSGLGGLSIWGAINRNWTCVEPSAKLGCSLKCSYYFDRVGFPWGNKTEDELDIRLSQMFEKFGLEWQSLDYLVIACNTLTTRRIEKIREKLRTVQVIGVVPAIKPAAQMTKSGHITVIATENACRSPYLKNLVHEHAKNLTTHLIPSPSAVRWAEAKLRNLLFDDSLNSEELIEFQNELKRELTHAVSLPSDIVVLGCTHFSFVQNEIRDCWGDSASKIRFVDAGQGVSKRLQELESRHNPATETDKSPSSVIELGDPYQWSDLMSDLKNAITIPSFYSISTE